MGDGSDQESRAWTSHFDKYSEDHEDQLDYDAWIHTAFENAPRASGEHGAISFTDLTSDIMDILSLKLSKGTMRSGGLINSLWTHLASKLKIVFERQPSKDSKRLYSWNLGIEYRLRSIMKLHTAAYNLA
jgi:hypothetical protein